MRAGTSLYRVTIKGNFENSSLVGYGNNSNPLDDTLFSLETLQKKTAQRCILIQYRSVTSNESLEVIKLYMISNIGQSFVKRTCETKVPRFYLFGLGIQSLNFLFMYYQSFLSDIIFSKCNCVHNV